MNGSDQANQDGMPWFGKSNPVPTTQKQIQIERVQSTLTSVDMFRPEIHITTEYTPSACKQNGREDRPERQTENGKKNVSLRTARGKLLDQ